jgi:hypothetical protein
MHQRPRKPRTRSVFRDRDQRANKLEAVPAKVRARNAARFIDRSYGIVVCEAQPHTEKRRPWWRRDRKV